MRSLFTKALFAVFFSAISVFAQAPHPVPITGSLTQISGQPGAYNGVLITLLGCPAPVSIPGYTAIVQQEYQIMADASGNVNGSVWPNDLLDCNGTTGTSQYQLTLLASGIPSGNPSCYQVTSSLSQWNLNTAQPIACVSPSPNPQDLTVNNLNVNGCISVKGGACSTPMFSKGVVVYASSLCNLNSNLTVGGGSDDSVCLQAILNGIAAAGGGELIQDGASLISAANVSTSGQTTALKISANTKLSCVGNGSGFFLANNSNVAMLGNNISGAVPFSNLEQNITVDSCTFSANGANQDRHELANPNNEWVFGLWFGGFDGLRLNNVTVLNSRTFGILLSWGQSFWVNNTSVVQLSAGAGGNNHDGLHFWGTLKDGHVNNFLDVNGDDDALAFNTDEGYTNYLGLVANGGWQPNRCPNSNLDGELDNITVDNGFLLNVNDPLRFFGTGDGIQTVSNIFLHNIYGNTAGGAICCGNHVTVSGGLSIDGWYVAGGSGNALPTPPNATPLQLSNIIPTATVSIGSGTSGPQLLSPTVITLNTGVLGAINAAWRSTPLAVLSLTNGGDLYFGNDEPDIWLRVAGQSAMNLNSTAGSGYTASLILPSTTRFIANGISLTTLNTVDDGSGNAQFQTFKPASARRGTFVCTAGGTITIANTNYSATSDVVITMHTAAGTISTPPAMKTVTPGTGFAVLCGASDTSTYNYSIQN